ncbi:MAG: GatB/YqeY domain-containing protein [Catalinimonas sp.]
MSLKSQIQNDIKSAMRAKDQVRLRTLRAIKSMILLEETKEGGSKELSDQDEVRLLTKAAKQRRESADIYRTQERVDLAETEEAELTVIEEYLPKQLSEAELRGRIEAIAAGVGAAGPADMGKVMGVASRELAGQAEGKTIAAVTREVLSAR